MIGECSFGLQAEVLFFRAFGSDGGLEAEASAPVKAFDQKGESPFQANVTGLKSTVVTAFP